LTKIFKKSTGAVKFFINLTSGWFNLAGKLFDKCPLIGSPMVGLWFPLIAFFFYSPKEIYQTLAYPFSRKVRQEVKKEIKRLREEGLSLAIRDKYEFIVAMSYIKNMMK